MSLFTSILHYPFSTGVLYSEFMSANDFDTVRRYAEVKACVYGSLSSEQLYYIHISLYNPALWFFIIYSTIQGTSVVAVYTCMYHGVYCVFE